MGTGTGTPGREPALPSSPQRKPGRQSASNDRAHPGVGSASFLVRLAAVSSSRPCESGTGGARRGGQGRAQARPQGLSLTAPSTAPGLGAVGTLGGRVPFVSSSATTTARSTGTGSGSARSAPPIKHRDCRALKQREPAYQNGAFILIS